MCENCERFKAERDEALADANDWVRELGRAHARAVAAEADAKKLREAGALWVSETGPGQHVNTAKGRSMMIAALGDGV